MGFVDEWPSRMQGEQFFLKSGKWAKIFNRVQKNLDFSLGGCPCPKLPPLKSLWGVRPPLGLAAQVGLHSRCFPTQTEIGFGHVRPLKTQRKILD